jgi:caffeoylshikimate esterase
MTSTMSPVQTEVETVVCFCHGYMDSSSFLKRHEYQRLVKRGVAFVAIEYEGHGRSDGELVYLPSWEENLHDVVGYFRQITNDKFPGKKCFLMGESMGGAIAFDVYDRCRNIPDLNWAGVVLCAPMCKISDELMPPAFVLKILEFLLGPLGSETWLGHLPIAPTKAANGFKLEHRRQLAQSVPTWPGCRKPRLATARELLVRTFLLFHLCCWEKRLALVTSTSPKLASCSHFAHILFVHAVTMYSSLHVVFRKRCKRLTLQC